MSVLDCQQHIAAHAAAAAAAGVGVGGLPSSFSLGDLMSHMASPLLPRDVATTADRASTLQAGEFSTSFREFRSVSRHCPGSLVESQRTFRSVESRVGNTPPIVTGPPALVEPRQIVGCGAYMTSPQRADSVQSGQVLVPTRHTVHDVLVPSRHTVHDVLVPSRPARPSLDLDREVFSDSASPVSSVDRPPPLPPKTSVVSARVSVCHRTNYCRYNGRRLVVHGST